jgi:hypothetical protein
MRVCYIISWITFCGLPIIDPSKLFPATWYFSLLCQNIPHCTSVGGEDYIEINAETLNQLQAAVTLWTEPVGLSVPS